MPNNKQILLDTILSKKFDNAVHCMEYIWLAGYDTYTAFLIASNLFQTEINIDFAKSTHLFHGTLNEYIIARELWKLLDKSKLKSNYYFPLRLVTNDEHELPLLEVDLSKNNVMVNDERVWFILLKHIETSSDASKKLTDIVSKALFSGVILSNGNHLHFKGFDFKTTVKVDWQFTIDALNRIQQNMIGL